MRFFRIFSRNESRQRKWGPYAKRTIFALVVAALFAGCAGCSQCKSCKSGEEETLVIRTPADVSDFSVVFINGEATLFWTDSKDSFLDHVEISWEPNGETPVTVDKGTGKLLVPGLKEGETYYFSVKAVDQWGNKSKGITGGTGKAYKLSRPADMPPGELTSISGTPVAGQATLSWTNLAPSEYEYIEITYDPNQEAVFRIPKGVENKTFMGLTNGVEHTFYAAAVDAQGNRKPLNEMGLFISDHATSPESVFGRPSQGQITLVWNDPDDPNLDHLEVVYSPNGEIPVIVPKGEQTKTFTDLSDSTHYEFTVYAASDIGSRKPVTGVNLFTPEAPSFTSEDAESFIIKGTPVAGQIRLDWTDPEMANLDHVEIIYNHGGGDIPVRVGKDIETKSFSGLSDDKEYSFIVYGVDARGNKRAIRGVNLTTPELHNLTAKPVSGQVTIVWDDPDEPNLDHIELTYSPGGDKPISVAKGVETYTFTDLSDNIEYEFFVKAVITEGTHAVAATDAIVPDLPSIIGIPEDGRLSLLWTDPKGINLDHIEMVYSPGGESPRLVATGMENQTFTGLTDGQEYAFTVYALDDHGNKHPVEAEFYTPEVAVAIPQEPLPPAKPGELGPLIWKPTNDTTFGESSVLALAYGQAGGGVNRWVAGGTDGKIAYSSDGINWIQVGESTFGSFSINSICYANGRWIAGGKSGKMAWSTNAVSWTAIRETSFTSEHSINTIQFANGRWIAGGSNGRIIWSDDNGATWNPVDIDAFGNSTVNTIAFHGNRWLAGGTEGKIAFSDDNGLSWMAVSDSTFGTAAILTLIYDRSRWMAGGYGTRIAWSADGLMWRTITRPFYILGMGFNGRRWVAGGQEGRMAWSGDSGDNWTTDDLGRNLFSESWVQAVAFGRMTADSGRWIAGGQNGKMIYADEQ